MAYVKVSSHLFMLILPIWRQMTWYVYRTVRKNLGRPRMQMCCYTRKSTIKIPKSVR